MERNKMIHERCVSYSMGFNGSYSIDSSAQRFIFDGFLRFTYIQLIYEFIGSYSMFHELIGAYSMSRGYHKRTWLRFRYLKISLFNVTVKDTPAK